MTVEGSTVTAAYAQGPDVWESQSWVWLWILPTALTLCSFALLGAETSDGRRALGLVGAAVVAVGHLTVGRRVMASCSRARSVTYLAAVLVGACVLFTIHPAFFFGLFGFYPLCFTIVDDRRIERGAVVLLAMASAVGIAGWNDWSRSAWLLSISESVVSVLFALGMGTWISRIIEQSRQRRALIDELETTRSALAEANRLQGVADERERLAAEIHDTLAQGFTSLLMLVQGADAALDVDPSRARALLDSAASTARENLAEARSLVAALQPVALQSSSLADAIRRLGERFQAETGIATSTVVRGLPRALPSGDEVVVLRAAQEALTNVRRHAGATKVEVVLDFGDADAPDRARLTITDDGRGFDASTADADADAEADAGGFGIAGMRSRAVAAGGWVDVRSSVGRGTSVEVVLP